MIDVFRSKTKKEVRLIRNQQDIFQCSVPTRSFNQTMDAELITDHTKNYRPTHDTNQETELSGGGEY